MAILSLHEVELAFGHVALLDRVSFSIERGERIGLIGRNGAGKSSLLAIVAGVREPDDGGIVRASGVSVALVEQEPDLPRDASVLDAVTSGLPAAADVAAYERAAARVATDHSEESMADLAHLQSALDANNGWAAAHRLERVMTRFDLDRDARVADLSGGQKKRVALARAMVVDPDLLETLYEPEAVARFHDALAELQKKLGKLTDEAVVRTLVSSLAQSPSRDLVLDRYSRWFDRHVDKQLPKVAALAVAFELTPVPWSRPRTAAVG